MNKTNYSKKYKDRAPEDTIKVIKDFFESYNYFIIEDVITQKESTSWYCDLDLYTKVNNKDICILSTHGKGISKEFALASGYAEMYERFANSLKINENPYLVKFIQEYNFKHFGYYLDPDEKEISLLDIEKDLNFRIFCSRIATPTVTDSEDLFNKLVGGHLVGVPFKHLYKEEIAYYNPVIYTALNGSNGMASGNTLEEATVQALSELVERQATFLYGKHPNDQYYIVNPKSIKSESIHKMIDSINATGNEVIIMDLSYNFNLPVVGIVIYNKSNKNYTIFHGAFPEFELAVERTITECYQRNVIINDNFYYGIDMDLFKIFEQRHTISHDILIADRDYNNSLESTFIKAKMVDSYNKDCFIESKDYSTQELLDYYKKLGQKLNYNFYIRETSLCSEFRSVLTYCPEFTPIPFDNTLPFREQTMQEYAEIYYSFLEDYDKFINATIISPGDYLQPITNIKTPCQIEDLTMNFKKCLTQEDDNVESLWEIYSYLMTSFYADYIKKYALLFKYRINNYTRQEIEDIFNYCGETFTNKDWYICADLNYIYNNIIKPASYEIFNDQTLENYLKPYLQGSSNDRLS